MEENVNSKTAKIPNAAGVENLKKPGSSLMHDFSDKNESNKSMFTKKIIIVFCLLFITGVASGYALVNTKASTIVSKSTGGLVSNVSKGKIYGSNDEKTFKDTAEGVLKEGGIDGEGAYHLERPGGDSQNVYLTSSFVDLSQFVNMKVKVWGQTNSSKKAGWLMDVGRLQIE